MNRIFVPLETMGQQFGRKMRNFGKAFGPC